MSRTEHVKRLIAARHHLAPEGGFRIPRQDEAAEGGCGVIGMACSEQIAARHMLQSLLQMRNRGNGKGGGIAAVGLVPEQFGVSEAVLKGDYLLALAYLEPEARQSVERGYVHSAFEIDHVHEQAHLEDYTVLGGLEVEPPEVVIYFVRPKEARLAEFRAVHDLGNLPQRAVEDEFVYQNSYQLSRAFYASTGEKQAFVLSHGKNLLVLKMVGFGDDVIRYYQIEDLRAHVWIGHHRYPTKGRVWHPGGAHPFVGLNEALVHNGDFANYASICEYLAQRNIYSLFLTDTEVSALVFDLLHRTYGYPLEYVVEALAPTTERDFTLLPADKQRIYRMLQTTHMHASPDGPWFFLIAQSDADPENGSVYRLTGITDTSMLRPQVFAWQENAWEGGPKSAIGLAASEKQAIDAALESLSAEDERFCSRADRYWNARGGSHTDGGAFIFSVRDSGNGQTGLVCTDKFGRVVSAEGPPAYRPNGRGKSQAMTIPDGSGEALYAWAVGQIPNWDYGEVLALLEGLAQAAERPERRAAVIEILTLLIDRRYPTGSLRRSSLLSLYDDGFDKVLGVIRESPSAEYFVLAHGDPLPEAANDGSTVVVDARGFPPEGAGSLAETLQKLYRGGFRRFLVAHAKGHRFIGNGFGPDTQGVRIDVYGSSGDYLASGLDGLELYVHGSGQDQLAQIMKSGRLVVHGDVGQTFMYGAKGGEAYVLGNAAGRPLINAVGKPRVVINGTCLDYLAESFMAGDPSNGGGFVVLNGISLNDQGEIVPLDTPYPGGNLFSLASGGAIYLRDPGGAVTDGQLNGGELLDLTAEDWDLIAPYLARNAAYFGIPVESLLTVDGELRSPGEVYRKVRPHTVCALQAEEAWVHGRK